MNTVLLFIVFASLALVGLLNERQRSLSLSRNPSEWIADVTGLIIQGVLIPAFPFFLVPELKQHLPELAGKLALHPVGQFVLSFVVIDYIYYWNHRIFHKRHLWAIHRLHHSARFLDIFATSRNSLITSFFFIYVWAQVLGLFFFKDCSWFMLGLALTFALDLWRHSGLEQPSWFHKTLGHIFILPEEHVLHHSTAGRTKNYGANFSLWDKLHGTYSSQRVKNSELEKQQQKSIWNELLTPWRKVP